MARCLVVAQRADPTNMKRNTAPKLKPTAAQEKAAVAVREYMKKHHLQIECDEVESDAHFAPNQQISISVSERDGAGYESPSMQLLERMRTHTLALRELSPLIYTSVESVDEWRTVTARIRVKRRQPRPTEVKNLLDLVKDRMPESITQHKCVRRLSRHHTNDLDGVVVISTTVLDRYQAQRDVYFGWRTEGSEAKGWTLLVRLGQREIRRKATYKKLTATIVLQLLDKLLRKLSDPLDVMGWRIRALVGKDYVLNASKRQPEDFYSFSVLDATKKKVVSSRGCTHVEFTNEYNGKCITLAVGELLPDELLAAIGAVGKEMIAD